MSLLRHAACLVFAFGLEGAACNGTTGDELVSFDAYAVGAKDAATPFVVNGYRIQLLSAKMHIGALYFDESPPSTGFDSPVCVTPDIYAAQVPGPVNVDLMSNKPQEFSVYGNGSADVALSWDIWLNDGTSFDDIDGANVLQMVDLTGVATRLSDDTAYSFGAIVTINNTTSGPGARATPASDPAQPGQYPICKARIIQLGGLDLPFYQGGTLTVTVDPTGWFKASNIDFATLDKSSDSDCQADANANQGYENGVACDSNTPCNNGFVCNTADKLCMAQYCIPDTNYGLGSGAEAGRNFFAALQGAGPLAYSVSYTGQDGGPPGP
jgi:hypothetical protein